MATTRRRPADNGGGDEDRRDDWVQPNMVKWGRNPTEYGLVVRVVDITPRLATEWLQYNTRNRKFKEEKIRQFMDDMQAGRWTLNGETILFSWMPGIDAWQLDDGQNRLKAVQDSGCTIQALVVFGVPFDETVRTTGTGVSRSGSDMFRILGEDNTAPLAGALALQWRYDRGILSFPRGKHQYATHMQLNDVLDAHGDIRTSVAVTQNLAKAIGIYPSVAAFLHYQFGKIDDNDNAFFWEHLRSGLDPRVGDQKQSMDEDQHPIHVLREWLIREQRRRSRDVSKRGVTQQILLGTILKTWKYFMLGESVSSSSKLVYRPAQGSRPAERWPEIYNPLAEDEEPEAEE